MTTETKQSDALIEACVALGLPKPAGHREAFEALQGVVRERDEAKAELSIAWGDCHDGSCNACAKCCDKQLDIARAVGVRASEAILENAALKQERGALAAKLAEVEDHRGALVEALALISADAERLRAKLAEVERERQTLRDLDEIRVIDIANAEAERDAALARVRELEEAMRRIEAQCSVDTSTFLAAAPAPEGGGTCCAGLRQRHAQAIAEMRHRCEQALAEERAHADSRAEILDELAVARDALEKAEIAVRAWQDLALDEKRVDDIRADERAKVEAEIVAWLRERATQRDDAALLDNKTKRTAYAEACRAAGAAIERGEHRRPGG